MALAKHRPDGVGRASGRHSASSPDITKQHQLAADYRSLFENMLDGFAVHEILLDEAGAPVDYRFLAVNPAFERITGLSAAQVVGRTAREALPGLEPVWITNYGQVALTGKSVRFEDYSAELGKWFEVLCVSARLRGASPPCSGTLLSACRPLAAIRLSEERYRQGLFRHLRRGLLLLPGGRPHADDRLVDRLLRSRLPATPWMNWWSGAAGGTLVIGRGPGGVPSERSQAGSRTR